MQKEWRAGSAAGPIKIIIKHLLWLNSFDEIDLKLYCMILSWSLIPRVSLESNMELRKNSNESSLNTSYSYVPNKRGVNEKIMCKKWTFFTFENIFWTLTSR